VVAIVSALHVEAMKMVTQKELGARFGALRKTAGYSQAQVSEKIGVSNETLSRLERGVQWTDFDVFVALAELYGVEFADLMAAHPGGTGGSQRVAIQEVVDLLRQRKAGDVELARDLLAVLFRER